MKIYIASGLQNAIEVERLSDELERAGHEITYRWHRHGSVQGQGVERMAEVADNELSGVREAEAVVVILPGGRGTHAELGAAAVLGTPVLVVGRDDYAFLDNGGKTCAFYHATGVERAIIPAFRDRATVVKTWLHDLAEAAAA